VVRIRHELFREKIARNKPVQEAWITQFRPARFAS
jgi:hypothetical protein